MKYIILIGLFCAGYGNTFAQQKADADIEDSVIGWWDNDKFDNRLKEAADAVQKQRVAVTDLFVSWMKKTYTPVGGLGTVTRINNKSSFGVTFLVWNVSHDKMWTDEHGRFKPIPEENTAFGMYCNMIPGSYAVPFLNHGGDYYFTWPCDGFGGNGGDPRIHPHVYGFVTRRNEWQTVFLCPGGKLPFTAVTKGEYLDSGMAMINKELQEKKDYILDQNRGSDQATVQRRESFYAYQEQEFGRYRDAIRKWREKYKERLNEPAVLRHMQPAIEADLYGDTDPFEIDPAARQLLQAYPVYKVSAGVMKQCQTQRPQWMAIYFPYASPVRGTQLLELIRSLTENFNYQYAYDYFFDPEQVKGKAYTPSDEKNRRARLDAYIQKHSHK